LTGAIQGLPTELKEWSDLKAVAGTGQAVAFGRWGYIGAFERLRTDNRSTMPLYILESRTIPRVPTARKAICECVPIRKLRSVAGIAVGRPVA
jgi:hypothetical protein